MKIKLGGYSSSRAKEYVWMRVGEAKPVEKFLTPYDAGIYVGSSLPVTVKITDLSFDYRRGGVEVPGFFIERVYISLYWCDIEAQWKRDLNSGENREFERGVKEGLE